MSTTVLATAQSFSKYSPEPAETLHAKGFQILRNDLGRPFTEEELIERIGSVDALVLGLDPLTDKVLAAADRLKIVCKHGVGLDNIDLAAAAAAGVVVTNAPDSNYNAVADLTIGLIIAAVRQIHTADRIVRDGRWAKVAGREIWQKTLGVIGTGRIGLGVCRRARGFDMRMLAHDAFPNQEAAAEIGFAYASLETVLTQSDVVTLHAPLTAETRAIIDAETLAMMKPGAVLVNTARGELVDEKALYDALTSGHLAGAAIDAYTHEPPTDNPLVALDQVVSTPHIGAYTHEANFRMGMAAAENIVRFFGGEPPMHIVTQP